MVKLSIRMLLSALFIGSLALFSYAEGPVAERKAWTLMCYMNGDNDLGDEVLHAVDMLESIGSSDEVNIVVMVDAHPEYVGERALETASTQVLYLTRDPVLGTLRSMPLLPFAELDMADPATLEAFVRYTRTHFPAERYMFATFTHGRGIIDYRRLDGGVACKAGAICPDDTSQSAMSIDDFGRSIRAGMAGEPLEMTVLFSCLTNMVEVGYSLRDMTRTLVASPAEIYLVNSPPGHFQVRGVRLENLVRQLTLTPEIKTSELATLLVDDYIEQYNQGVALTDADGAVQTVRYPGAMAALDCTYYDPLVTMLDQLAAEIIDHLEGVAAGGTPAVYRLRSVADRVQSYRSFLNLEYVDLAALLQEIQRLELNPSITMTATMALDVLKQDLIVYARQSDDMASSGVAVYFPDSRIPENIFAAHHGAYRQTSFGQATQWASMIQRLRVHGQID